MGLPMQVVGCFIGTILFSVLLNQPPKTMIFSGIIGTLGYFVFELLHETTMAYFFATLTIALLCEIAARIFKKAATLYLISALIPIVPGIGLYRTMRYLVEDNVAMSAQVGIETLMGVCAIALAITCSSIVFSNIPRKRAQKVNHAGK